MTARISWKVKIPILNADRSRTFVLIKHCRGPGFAGIPNTLFAPGNTLMLFGAGLNGRGRR